MADDLLGPLADEPVPPLAPAAVVRARGEQRSRRRRAALAGATALTLVLAGGVGIALNQPTGTDELSPEPFATRGTPDATPSPVPSPTTEAPQVTPQQLLDGPSVETVLGGSWSSTADLREHVYASAFICPEGPPPAVAGLTRGLESTDGQQLGSEVLAFAGEARAADVHAQLRADIERCPTRPEDSEDGRATASHELVPGLQTTVDRFYLQSTSRDCDGCAERVTVTAVARVGQWLVLVGGSPNIEADLPRLADAAVARAGGDAPPKASSEPPPPWPLAAVYLTPDAAGEAEEPGWTVTSPSAPADEPLADPCREGSAPLSEAVRESAERAMGSTREHGGSNLAQEVYRYSSARIAQDAFRVHEERYTRCAEAPAPDSPEDTTVRSEVVDRGPGRLVVRRIPCMSGNCAEHFSTYEIVLQQANAVTVVAYAISEDGDPAEGAVALADAAERRLREAVRP